MPKAVKALIVEDNASFHRTIRAMLASRFPSMRIEGARDGQEALQKLKRYEPDLVISDIRLPGESGLVLTKKIRNLYPQVVIVILTNYDLPEYREAAFQNGAQYFFSKESTKANEILDLAETILADVK